MRNTLALLVALCLAACSQAPSEQTSADPDAPAQQAASTPIDNEDTRADMPGQRPTPPSPLLDGRGLPTSLASVASFESITDPAARSAALWEEAFKVVGHPRCMNCHNVDGPITQGDDMLPHQPMIVRGDDTFGAVGMRCTTCHGQANFDYVGTEGSMPGHEVWHVAPIEMGWQGLSSGEICEKVKARETNGDRSLEEIWEHNAHDGLVGWGWNPGKGRTPAPGTQAQFGELTRAWIDTGAVCPS